MLLRSSVKHIFFSFLFVLLFWGFNPLAGRGASVIDNPLEITLAAFRQVDCMDAKRYNYYKDIIRNLSYTRMRALRAFCYLDEIYAEEAIDSLEKLSFYPLSFDQVQFFETFAELTGVTGSKSWQLLDLSSGLEFTAMQTLPALAGVKGIDADTMIDLVAGIKELDDYGRWAAKALFSIKNIDKNSVLQGLGLIKAMTTEQKLSAEQGCLIDSMDAQMIMKILPRVGRLSAADGVNSKGLFSLDSTTPDQALAWLNDYFNLPDDKADSRFYTLKNEQRSILLSSFDSASDYHIRKINDLHAVTNRYGGEISTGTLAAGGSPMVMAHFAKLHPKAGNSYKKALAEAIGQKKIYPAIDVLKQATAFARKQTARDLSTANIYILLSHGSELYDSSFRNVLVPVLLSRIKASFRSNLLHFLKETDPDNGYVSDFIISCAQKGELTAFFPKNSAEQRQVLDLIAESAFQDEQSLILFSATFATLLEKLVSDARTYLLKKMIATIKKPDSTFSLQLRVILQYYFEKHPALLSAADHQLITDLIRRYGAIDLSLYTATDFTRWKADNRLSSLSIFQHDNDGKISYLSNFRNLLKNGYRARLSETISLLDQNDPAGEEARLLIARGDTDSLYKLSVARPVVVEYYKTVNGIELTHAVAVYQSRSVQRRLLKKYLLSGMEMFAQRGHSYWRQEQLLEPVRQLLKSKEIEPGTIPDINRFLSIGSCGGIRIYSELNRLFDNSIDIFATVGTGKAIVNDPYNQRLFEIIASSPNQLSWEEVSFRLTSIFVDGRGSDYLQPGSLPATLHKMMDTRSLN